MASGMDRGPQDQDRHLPYQDRGQDKHPPDQDRYLPYQDRGQDRHPPDQDRCLPYQDRGQDRCLPYQNGDPLNAPPYPPESPAISTQDRAAPGTQLLRQHCHVLI